MSISANIMLITIGYLFTLMLQEAAGMRHRVYWDKNCIPELGGEGLEFDVEVNDWMDVLCPYRNNHDESIALPMTDYFLIYNVTEHEFKSCDTRRRNKLQDCDDPLTEKKLTTKFQERSPSPFGFVFRPDATYYYISKPVHDSSKGCTESTLKMIVNVKKKGTVFDPEDRSIRFYHHERSSKQPDNNASPKSSSRLATGHSRNPKRHNRHHHEATNVKSTATSTTKLSEKPVLKGISLSRSSSQTDGKDGNKSNPENSSRSCMRCSEMVAITALVTLAFWVLCLR